MSDPGPPVTDEGPTEGSADTPLAGLCTTGDISGRLMRPLTDAEATAAPLFIADASGLIRRYCNQVFTLEQSTDVLQIRNDGSVRCPQRPVASIDYVAVINPDGAETPVMTWWWDKIDTFRLGYDDAWVINLPARWVDETPGTVKVTYTHGYDELPPELTGVCAAAVIRRLTEPAAHLKEMQVGYYREFYYDAQSPGSVYLTVDDKLALKDFRAGATSIRLA